LLCPRTRRASEGRHCPSLIDSPNRMRKNAPYDQKTVIPAAAKRRAGIQKPLKCLDSRFRGNDDKSSSIASFRAVSEFFRTLLS
jgi:hypothetical protein